MPRPPHHQHLVAVLLIALVTAPLVAQPVERVGIQTVHLVGARMEALGGGGTALPGSWIQANPSSLARAPSGQLRLYADQGFGLPELRAGAFQVSTPVGLSGLGMSVQTLGFEAFRVSALTVAAGRAVRLGTQRTLDAGVGVTVHHARIDGYGSGVALALSAGLRTEVLPELDFGVSGQNLLGAKLAGLEPVPQLLAVGLRYHPAAGLEAVLDLVDDTRFPLSVRAGVEVHPVERVALRVGTATAPATFSAGAGLALGPLRADLAATRHEVLGWTPAVEVGVVW